MIRPLFKRFLVVLAVLTMAIYYVWPPKDKISLGLDLKGGTSYTVKLDLEKIESTRRSGILDKAMEIYRKRVDPNGLGEITIQPAGDDRIVVQIPVVDEAKKQETLKLLEQIAYLEFRLVHPNNSQEVARIKNEHASVPSGYELMKMSRKEAGQVVGEEEVLVKRKVELTGVHLIEAFPTRGPAGFAVSFTFNSKGAEIFRRVTGENKGSRLAIVLDKNLISAPTINSEIGARGEITGDFDFQEAVTLANALANPLETPGHVVEERGVDASLGKDSIRSGVTAGIVGLSLVVAFMAIYYLRAGIVANIALMVNIILLFGVLAIFKFTLTLPGIAGIILTVGIAVDANVLIYERIREELRKGKPLVAAIDAGFDRAFGTIVDANVTTLITALVLSWLGTGPVQGFGYTLSAGIITSVFSAVFVSRLIFDFLLRYMPFKKFTMLSLVKQTDFNFLGMKWPAIALSLGIIIMGAVIVFKKGNAIAGVDFAGGDALTLKASEHVDVSDLRKALDGAGIKEATLQYQREIKGTGESLMVKVPFGLGKKAEDTLKEAFPKTGFTEGKLDRIGGTVGKELQWTALKGLLVAALCILIYITARFEFAYALGAIIALLHDVLICLAFFFLTDRQLSLPAIGALLTIAGYSLNDTIVVFDRIREEFKLKGAKFGFAQLINLSVNETLSRTLLTSLTTLIAGVALYVFGGGVINDFAFILVVGVITGTYSSVFIASPVLLLWHPSKLAPQTEDKSSLSERQVV